MSTIVTFVLMCIATDLVSANIGRPQCGLCNKFSMSCGMQLPQQFIKDENDEDACWMTYYENNGHDCRHLTFKETSTGDELGNMVLSSYLYSDGAQNIVRVTAFNISFSDIKFEVVRMRFQRNDGKHSFCREFNVDVEAALLDPQPVLFFDCLWHNSTYENTTYKLEVDMENGDSYSYRKYTFRVPVSDRADFGARKLQDRQVFMYVDITDPSQLTLHFQKLSGISQYLVSMQSKEDSEMMPPTELICESASCSKQFATPVGDPFCMFVLQPLDTEICPTGCAISTSPVINLVDTFGLSKLAIFTVLIVVVLAVVIALICMKSRIQTGTYATKSKVLFIYKPTHKSHVDVIDKLAAFVEQSGIAVLLDRRDIQNKDPYDWYCEAFDEADFVVVFSSLQCCPADLVGIHRRIDDVALVQLKGAVADKTKKFIRVLLPYCKKDDIPKEASKFKLIHLPQDLNYFISYLRGLNRFNYLIGLSIREKETTELKELRASLAEAVATLSKHHTITADPGMENSGAHSKSLYTDKENADEDDKMLISVESNAESPTDTSINLKPTYPNLANLNLSGENPDHLVPSVSSAASRCRKDILNGISLDNMRL